MASLCKSFLLLCLILVPAACFAQSSPAGKVVTDRWYAFSLSGTPAGYFHVVRRQVPGEAAPVRFEHEFAVKWRGEAMVLRMRTTCKDDPYFTPVKIISEGKGEEVASFEAHIADGKMRVTADGKEYEEAIPEHTVTDFALLEIIRRLPFRAGVVFQFHSLEASELNLKRNHKITYVGGEELELAGKTVSLHRFEQTGEGIRPCQFWVDDQHELIRVLMDERKEVLLTTEKEAKSRLP